MKFVMQYSDICGYYICVQFATSPCLFSYTSWENIVSDIAVFVLKRDVKLQLTHSWEYITPENVLLFSVTRCIPVKRTGLDGSEKDTYVGTFEKFALNVEVTTSCPYTCTYTYTCSPLVNGCVSDAVQKIHCLSLVDLRDQLNHMWQADGLFMLCRWMRMLPVLALVQTDTALLSRRSLCQ